MNWVVFCENKPVCLYFATTDHRLSARYQVVEGQRTHNRLIALPKSQASGELQEIQDYLKTISPNLVIVRGDFDEGDHPDEQVGLSKSRQLQSPRIALATGCNQHAFCLGSWHNLTVAQLMPLQHSGSCQIRYSF